MRSMLELCSIFIIIRAVTARPAVPVLPGPWDQPGQTSLSLPILSGPWNAPEAGSSSVSGSVSLTLSSSSLLSTSTSASSNSSVSTSRSSSSSLASSAVFRTASNTQPPATTSSASVRSTTVRLPASTTGSASNTHSVTGVQNTKLSTAWTVFDHSQSSKSVLSTSKPQKPSSKSTSSRPPSLTVSGGQIPVASKTQSPFPISSGRGNSTLTTPTSSSLNIFSVIARPSANVSSVVSASKLLPVTSIANTSSASTVPKATAFSSPCGPVAQYYSPTPKNWTDHNTDVWLNTWVNNNVGQIAANTYGFTGAFATWAIGDPGFNCQDDGATGNCDFDPCNNAMLNSKGGDVPQAYYVMQSAVGIHTYFTGLREAFTISSIGAALSKDSWAETFYKDKDDKSVVALREIFNVIAITVGIIAALSGIGGIVAGTIAGVGATLWNGAYGAYSPTLGQHADDTFKKSADLGKLLGDIVIGTIESFTSANNILMHGQNYIGTGDLRDYWRGGAFVDYPGVDKNAVTNTMNSFLIGQAINQLYRQQKIFIMGGGACGDNQGIGVGPQGYSVCRDGKAWYLYWWQENDVISLTMHQWGWVSPPVGSDQLGQGDYANVTIQDIINSSLDAYIVAGYKYTNQTAYDRAESAITQRWANPAAEGPAWEGIFTIPVCNVSLAVNSDYYDKDWILQDFGHDSRPVWCGPVCDGDVQKTKDFIHAANMDNFQSPRHMCDGDTPGAWWEGPLGT